MIYSEEVRFDKNDILDVHINAYFGELERFKDEITDAEHQDTLTICSILNGEWHKELKKVEIAITKHLFNK